MQTKMRVDVSKKPFIPDILPPSNLDTQILIKPLGEAHQAFGAYTRLLERLEKMINPDLFLGSFRSNEAISSSRIEGSQTKLREIIGTSDDQESKDKNPEKRDDFKEVINYRRTLKLAKKDDIPFSLYLIRQCHHELLQGSVRGSKKNPGKIRTTQNYIGSVHKGIEGARFIPPAPELVESALENLIEYVNSPKEDILLQTAILHGQFEIIHPFDDGNGRVGRLLVPLFLYKRKYIKHPCFYVSEFFEDNLEEYYDQLLNIAKTKKWEEWLLFFLHGVKAQSQTLTNRLDEMLNLYKSTTEKVYQAIQSKYFSKIVDYIFKKPRFNIPKMVDELGIKERTMHTLVESLEKQKIVKIHKKAKGTKPADWIFPDLFSILGENFEDKFEDI